MEWEVKVPRQSPLLGRFGSLELSGMQAEDILGLFEVCLAARQAFWGKVGDCF